MNRTVRDVSGAASFEKNAAVRAFATAPSIANTIVGEFSAFGTPDSTRTPRMRPLRSTMAIIASFREVAADARSSIDSTSLAVTMGPDSDKADSDALAG